MPRTNARVWPKDHSLDRGSNDGYIPPADTCQPPVVSREEWIIPGVSNNLPVVDSNTVFPPYIQHSPAAHHQQLHYNQSIAAVHHQVIPPPWVQLNQYNPNEAVSYTTNGIQSHHNQTYPKPQHTHSKTAADYIYPECHKQELWVDGPTEFTKNLQTLTSRLQNDLISPQHNKTHYGDRKSVV